MRPAGTACPEAARNPRATQPAQPSPRGPAGPAAHTPRPDAAEDVPGLEPWPAGRTGHDTIGARSCPARMDAAARQRGGSRRAGPLACGVLNVPQDGADQVHGVLKRGLGGDGQRPGRGRVGLARKPALINGVPGPDGRPGGKHLRAAGREAKAAPSARGWVTAAPRPAGARRALGPGWRGPAAFPGLPQGLDLCWPGEDSGAVGRSVVSAGSGATSGIGSGPRLSSGFAGWPPVRGKL
jgi:hypothetical protein